MMEMIGRVSVVTLLMVGSLSGCATVGRLSGGDPAETEEEVQHLPMEEIEVEPDSFVARARGTFVVVDVDLNRLRFMDGDEVLWEAPVGTGTGLRLKTDDNDWKFSTPQGVFQVVFKEELPVWYLPDWYFVEKNLPIPPENSPERKAPGQLGVAAVYLGDEIAIHGTDKPELLGQRVSHGCIRLENKYAQRLYHNVQIGTPIVIRGGKNLKPVLASQTTTPDKPRPKPKDPLAGVPTADLLKRLDRSFANGDTAGVWVPLASRLITRGLHRDDADALRGLLERAGKAKTEKLNREYATFLADAFARGALRTSVSLGRIDSKERARAAEAIVGATMRAYSGAPDDQLAPWPTRRVPPTGLGATGKLGWSAVQAAEESYRKALAAEQEVASLPSRMQ